MADEINNVGTDATKTLSNGAITNFNSQNTVLTGVDSLQKWYIEHQTNLMQEGAKTSRISTAIDGPEIEGLSTVEENIEGLQTNIKIDEVEEEQQTSKLQTKVFQQKSNNINAKTSKLATQINRNDVDEDTVEPISNLQSEDKANQLQTKVNNSNKVDKLNKISQNTSKAIKGVKGINRVGKVLARTGRQLQTLSTGGDGGKAFTDDFKYATGKTVEKITKVATKNIKRKRTTKLTQLAIKVGKVVVQAVIKAASSIISFIVETAPVSIPIIAIVIVVIILCATIGGLNPIFGENSSNDTIENYAEYIVNYEGEHSANIEWHIPLAYIYILDNNIQYDEGEQYLLNRINEEGLLNSISSSTDYKNFFTKHNDVILEFYRLSGINSTEINIDSWKETVDYIEDEPDEFMSIINKKLEDYETSYTGTGNGKFIYPTSITQISAGYPNYSNGSYHGGIDFPVKLGTNVGASSDGIVVISTALRNPDGSYRSYGEYIAIDHGKGVRTYYCHLTSRSVKVGDTVKQGQVIGKSGSTGNSTGPHLHFEVRVNNTRVNPMPYLTNNN